MVENADKYHLTSSYVKSKIKNLLNIFSKKNATITVKSRPKNCRLNLLSGRIIGSTICTTSLPIHESYAPGNQDNKA